MKHEPNNRGGGWSPKSQRKLQDAYLVNQAKNSVGKKGQPEALDTQPSGHFDKDGHLVK